MKKIFIGILIFIAAVIIYSIAFRPSNAEVKQQMQDIQQMIDNNR